MVTYLVIHPWVMLQGNKRSHSALLVNPSVDGKDEKDWINPREQAKWGGV